MAPRHSGDTSRTDCYVSRMHLATTADKDAKRFRQERRGGRHSCSLPDDGRPAECLCGRVQLCTPKIDHMYTGRQPSMTDRQIWHRWFMSMILRTHSRQAVCPQGCNATRTTRSFKQIAQVEAVLPLFVISIPSIPLLSGGLERRERIQVSLFVCDLTCPGFPPLPHAVFEHVGIASFVV